MQEDKLPDEPLFRYVLGDLTEAEQTRVEEEYFADPARQQELWAVFDDVAERFLEGELAAADAQKFAARLQASPVLRERVARLQAVLHTIAAQPPSLAPSAPPKVPSRWAKWFVWPAWQGGLAATALLLLALGVVWRNRQPPGQEMAQITPSVAPTSSSPTPTVVARATPQPTAEPHPRPTASPRVTTAQVATFFLLQETVRDRNAATPLAITKAVAVLELHLEVRPPLSPGYQVSVQTAAGQTLITAQNLRPQRRDQMTFLTVRIPVAKLPEEAFTVRIYSLSAGQEPKLSGAHSLQVVKP